MHDYKAQSIAYEQGICKHQTRTVDDILWTSLSQLQTGLSYALYNNQLLMYFSHSQAPPSFLSLAVWSNWKKAEIF